MVLTLCLPSSCRAHGRALLVTFNADDNGSAHVDALTHDIQSTFKWVLHVTLACSEATEYMKHAPVNCRRIEKEIKSIDEGPGSQEDVATRKTIQRSLAQVSRGSHACT
jgi:hypothetical protein